MRRARAGARWLCDTARRLAGLPSTVLCMGANPVAAPHTAARQHSEILRDMESMRRFQVRLLIRRGKGEELLQTE